MIAVAGKHENASDDMMRDHLPMVFPSFLDVDHDNLLHPKSKLYEVIPFEQAAHFPVRPIGPELAQIKPVVRIVHDILPINQQTIAYRIRVTLTIPRDQNVES